MPNWCSNEITIYGDEKKMKPIVEKLRKLEGTDELVMTTLIGAPDEKNKKQDNFYAGQLERFGTKWDFTLTGDFAPYYEIEGDRVYFSLQTAWSPPTDFLERLCITHKVHAEVVYSEPGCDFAGKAEYGPDGVVYDDQYSYLEGLYHYGENFWEEVDFLAQCAVDNEDSLETFLGGMDFLTDAEKEEAKAYYENNS